MLRKLSHYERPKTIEEAVALAQSNQAAQYLGGGAWIVAKGDPALTTVIDLQGLGLHQIHSDLEAMHIGATATLQALIEHPDTAQFGDGILAKAARLTQSRNLREQGTLGGTLIVAGSADPLTTVFLVCDAELLYADPAPHSAPFTSFVAYRERLIAVKALITGLRLKRLAARTALSYHTVGRSPMDKPIVGAAAYVSIDEGLAAEVRLAIGGIAPLPVRLTKTELWLKGQRLDEERIKAALAVGLEGMAGISDYRGSAEYRLEMARVLGRRALLEAWEKARQLPR